MTAAGGPRRTGALPLEVDPSIVSGSVSQNTVPWQRQIVAARDV